MTRIAAPQDGAPPASRDDRLLEGDEDGVRSEVTDCFDLSAVTATAADALFGDWGCHTFQVR